MSEGGYIQGAGDDSEAWAHGLTPPVFWANRSTLVETAEEELPELIGRLVKEYDKQDTRQQAIRVAPTQNLYISKTDDRLSESGLYDLVIDCNGTPDAHSEDAKRLNLGCASGKLGGRDLRNRLDKVRAFVASHFAQDPSRSLLVMCETGKDLSAGALLAIICIFYGDNGALSPSWPRFSSKLTSTGNFHPSSDKQPINKQLIRQRLAWIVSSKHDLNPSRTTLQSVNAFLMERPDY